jgi:small subunit ribosomal protein S1
MGYRPEDLELDNGYWQSLLKDAEVWDAERPAGEPKNAGANKTDRERPEEPRESQREPRASSHPVHAQSIVDGVAPAVPPAQDGAQAAPMLSSSELWEALREAMQRGSTLDVEVTGCNRGGLIVRYHTLRGFVPSSHLHVISPEMDEPARRIKLAQQIGTHITARVIELDRDRDRVVFSERTATGEPSTEIPALLREIRAGETRRGRVTNLTAFGAFVDLGGYEGLIHVSEISWSRVGHPRDVLSIGQEIDVFVLSVSADEGRIALSLKRTRPDPWHGIESRYKVGQLVHGMVTNVVDFGVFVKVEEDLEGLIHVSELAEGNFLHPRNIVREGQMITGRVIGVDGSLRRLALSLRNVNGH